LVAALELLMVAQAATVAQAVQVLAPVA
jgi:hypothetical protein